LLAGCGSGGDKNLWDASDEVFFFKGLEDGDTNVPINAVFGFKPSKAVDTMRLYDSNGYEVPSEIHTDDDGHWYLSPDDFLSTYTWYTLEVVFEDATTISIDFETGGSISTTAETKQSGSLKGRTPLLIKIPTKS
jgi:hypothetical protein